ncbi:MAC/perforin domain-containing protein [Pectobacterium versatile]|uniref:MAC/perforin domain-containing protein n=1 Tax=Pectobacterium versatile TaxID=2488639 RepID=UPI001CC9C730|nr:MAC/perforin domain-containing protein [Pectobacterium versatile]
MDNIAFPKGNMKYTNDHSLKLLRLQSSLGENILLGVEAIGLGYNPFIPNAGYATVSSGTVQLFDWAHANMKKVSFMPEFEVPEVVDVQQEDRSSYRNITGKTITEYQSKLATNVAMKGSYHFFSGSLSIDYEENSLRNAENEFTRIQQTINLWSLRLSFLKSLRSLMKAEIREQLDELDTNNPDAISVFFNRFGSHFLTGIVMGARATLASSTDKLSVKRDYSISTVAQASYEGLTGQLSAENHTKYGESISSFSQYSTSHQEVLGGNGSLASGVFTGKEGYQKWVDSVGSSPDFVDFVPTMPMEEIWLLCENEQQANAMASHYNTVWAPEQSAKYKINPNYINELIVITGGSSTITPPSGYTKIPYDLNKGSDGDFIYLCYHEQEWISDNPKQAITNIQIIYNDEKTPTGYIKLPQDLNKGADGAYVYLCYKKEDYHLDTAIKKITVIGGNNADINAPYGYNKIPGDLNKGADGQYIYVCTFVEV